LHCKREREEKLVFDGKNSRDFLISKANAFFLLLNFRNTIIRLREEKKYSSFLIVWWRISDAVMAGFCLKVEL